MANPRTFEKDLSSYGYHMEVDTRKSDCNRERTPHWHLCGKHDRIGSISIYGDWIETPDADRKIIKEAEELTSRYSPDIRDAYEYNRVNGSDY